MSADRVSAYAAAHVHVLLGDQHQLLRPSDVVAGAWPFEDRAPRLVVTAHDPGELRPPAWNQRAQTRLELALTSEGELWPAVGGDAGFRHRETSVVVRETPEVLHAAAEAGQDAVFRWSPDRWEVLAPDGRVLTTAGWRLLTTGPLATRSRAGDDVVWWYPLGDRVLVERGPAAQRRSRAALALSRCRTVGQVERVDRHFDLGYVDADDDLWSVVPDEESAELAQGYDARQRLERLDDHPALRHAEWPHPHEDDAWWPDELADLAEEDDGFPALPLSALATVLAVLRGDGWRPRRVHPGYVPGAAPSLQAPSLSDPEEA